MSRALITINGNADRERVVALLAKAPPGTRVEFKAAKRTLDQNARMWAMLTDISRQFPWHGVKMDTESWKLIFMDGLKQELRMVPNLQGNGFVNLGRSSSKLSKQEMSDLIELMFAWGAEKGIKWSDPTLKDEEQVA